MSVVDPISRRIERLEDRMLEVEKSLVAMQTRQETMHEENRNQLAGMSVRANRRDNWLRGGVYLAATVLLSNIGLFFQALSHHK